MVISIASQKGGTGKTSTTISLAAGLAHRGKKVLLIDIDSQANSSKVLLPNYVALRKEDTLYVTILEKKALPIRSTSISNLDIVPAHILLSHTDVELTTAIDHREERLKNKLDSVKGKYDYILIDCPPALSWLTINAFTASDQVLVNTRPVRFPPCAAGASPTIYTRAFGSPHPGTGLPQYSSPRYIRRFSNATFSRNSTSRGHFVHVIIV